MPLNIVRNDITKMRVDAIVNAANSSLMRGGGVDGCIHRMAGPGLLEECKTLGGCNTGEAKITKGYNLPSEYVIHTVGPVYKDGNHNEKSLLEGCYRNSLRLAKEYKCETVAFPIISSGIYGYPKAEALKVATDVITEFLLENDMTVYIVVFDKTAYQISEKLFSDIKEYIDDNYVSHQAKLYPERCRPIPMQTETDCEGVPDVTFALPMAAAKPVKEKKTLFRRKASLEEYVNNLDESFSEMLLRKIDEKGMKDSECYKKANIDRKLFSKIRSDINYKPSKPTVIAFAVALELSLDETKDMLKKAGFALSHSNKFDVIIEYFIVNGNYNIFEINEALFAFDQNLLGA